jgi:O-antigen/teichoic acid export membrane protein
VSLKRQVASSLFWVALSQLFGSGLTLVTSLIVAKLLGPAALGLVGMAGLAIAALQYFQNIGFDAALIYRRDEVENASHTAFVTVIASSLVVYLTAVLAAPWVALFFREPAVTPILRVLALTILISSVGRVPAILMERELNFRRRILPELTANAIGSGTAIALALSGVGVWSLVWGQLIGTTLASALVWFVTSWRPRLRFRPQLARELFRYGKHIVGSQTLIFLITNVDNAVVGRYAGDAALGFYSFAYNLSNRPATQIASVLTRVMFPALAKLSSSAVEAAEARGRYYMTIVHYVTWLTAPIAAATILFAPEFINGLYGPEWAPAITPLQLLAIYGFVRSIAANMGSVLRAMGKPHWLTSIAIWRLATMLATLYPVTKLWGITGVSWLSAIVAVVDFIISATLVGKVVDAPWRAYARILIPTLVAALAAGVLAHWLYPFLPLAKTAWRLLAAGVVLVILYGALIWLADAQLRAAVAAGFAYLRRWYRRC